MQNGIPTKREMAVGTGSDEGHLVSEEVPTGGDLSNSGWTRSVGYHGSGQDEGCIVYDSFPNREGSDSWDH